MRRVVLIGVVVATLLLAACTSEGETPGDGTLDPSGPDTTSAPATTSAPDTTSAPATTSAPDASTDPGNVEDNDAMVWVLVAFIVLLIAGIVWAASRSGAKKGAADQVQAQQAADYQAQQAAQQAQQPPPPPASSVDGTEDPPAPAPPS